jgi:hypothetical protein
LAEAACSSPCSSAPARSTSQTAHGVLEIPRDFKDALHFVAEFIESRLVVDDLEAFTKLVTALDDIDGRRLRQTDLPINCWIQVFGSIYTTARQGFCLQRWASARARLSTSEFWLPIQS